MRRWLTTAILTLVAICSAHGAESTCGRPGGGAFSAEWVEGGELWGARIITIDPKWALRPSIDAGNTAYCETCEGDQIRLVYFGLGVRDSADRDVDKEISPERFAERMMLLQMPPAEFRANSDPKPVTIAGLEGRARKIGIRSSDGRSYEAITLFVSQGCLGLSAIAWARNGVEVPFDRIGALSSAIDIQRYGPLPDPCPPRPRAPEDVPLLEKLQEKPGCPPAGGMAGSFASPNPQAGLRAS